MWAIRVYDGARDRDQVLALVGRLTEGVAAWRDRDRWRTVSRGWVEDSMAAAGGDDQQVFVVVPEGDVERVAGFVSVGSKKHFTGDVDAYVGELVVAASAEGSGAGSALMAAAEAWARARGHARLTLDTGAANVRARAFYGRLGFLDEDVKLTKTLSA